jgi:hypothetical protein
MDRESTHVLTTRNKMSKNTENSAQAESTKHQSAKYGRVGDIQRLFGLTKSTIYNLLRSGRIRGCALQVKGKRSRIRLIDVSSVSAFIEAAMNEQGGRQ